MKNKEQVNQYRKETTIESIANFIKQIKEQKIRNSITENKSQ